MKYYIHENGQQIGPLTIEQLKTRGFTSETPIWCEGMDKWGKAKDIPELTAILNSTTPPSFNQQPQQQQPQNNTEPTQPCPNNHMVMAILSTIVTFFCCSGIPIGIISLIYALEVESKWKQGKYDQAIKNSRNARTWGIISFISAFSGFIILFIYIFLIIGLEAFLMLL